MKRAYCYVEKVDTTVRDDFICHPECEEVRRIVITLNNMASSHHTHLKCNCESVRKKLYRAANAMLKPVTDYRF